MSHLDRHTADHAREACLDRSKSAGVDRDVAHEGNGVPDGPRFGGLDHDTCVGSGFRIYRGAPFIGGVRPGVVLSTHHRIGFDIKGMRLDHLPLPTR